MWDKLGFKENPYSTKPLRATSEDVELLIGRQEESIDFATALESASNGVIILSGMPGVGKTSFLNIQQYLLERKLLGFGPKIIAARQLCPVQSNDTPKDIALRGLSSLVRSIELYCNEYNQQMPKNVDSVRKWLTQKNNGVGIQFGLTIMGFGGNFGRELSLPSLSEISYEGLIDIITSIVQESIKEFEAESMILVLDNLENLEEAFLGTLLMNFRDTLFSIENLYWVLIGQSGLASLIQTLDNRVFQRLTSSIELTPITQEELKAAIDVRVQKFHNKGSGKSPISESVYKKLYNYSNGEIRFVFKYCSEICINFASAIRKDILKKGIGKVSMDIWDQYIGEFMISHEFKDEHSDVYLMQIVKKEFDGLNLKNKDKEVLQKIGSKKQARAKDFREYNVRTMQDFSSNFLNRLANQGLLLRRQEGRAVLYELRGLILLANEYGFLSIDGTQ
jgi:Cdc6-like AAA superfamily ATPase